MRDVKPPKLRSLVVNNPNDVALKWTGEKVMGDRARKASKKRGPKRYRYNFVCNHRDGLGALAKRKGVSRGALLNMLLEREMRKYGI